MRPLEKSTPESSAARVESRAFEREVLKPSEDGFYQLGYRQALSDVLYITGFAVLVFALVQVFPGQKSGS